MGLEPLGRDCHLLSPAPTRPTAGLAPPVAGADPRDLRRFGPHLTPRRAILRVLRCVDAQENGAAVSGLWVRRADPGVVSRGGFAREDLLVEADLSAVSQP